MAALVLRSQLLRALLAGSLVGCADPAPPARDAAGRALEYLRTTRDEAGIDVAVAVQIYGERSGDRRADAVVDALRARARPRDSAQFGALLGASKPPFPDAHAGALPEQPATGMTPDEDGDRARSCMLEVLACGVSDACRDFAQSLASGSILTHQAVWLLFARWSRCEVDLDTEALRHAYASRLLAEARADEVTSDLWFERLAMLASLGFAKAIEARWLDALYASQQPEGCFPASAETPCHPHPTALALWVLGHAKPDR